MNGSQGTILNRKARRAIAARLRPRFKELAAAARAKREEAIAHRDDEDSELRTPNSGFDDSTNRKFTGGETR